jgi:hypothetical protein
LVPQTSEQRPQFSLLFWRFTHVVPQRTNPEAWQLAAHVPSLQIGVAPVQRLPQAPQSRLFDERSTQVPTPPFRPAHCV